MTPLWLLDAGADPVERLDEILRADPDLCKGLHRVLTAEARDLHDRHGVTLKPGFVQLIDLLAELGYRRRVPGPVPAPADLSRWPQDFVTLEQAARSLGWSTSYTRRMCRRGRLSSIQRDGRWFVQRNAISSPQHDAV